MADTKLNITTTNTYQTNCKVYGKPFLESITLLRLIGTYQPEETSCPHCQAINNLGKNNG